MALMDENTGTGMVMPVAPMYGGGMGSGFGNGFGDSNGWWILLLFILLGGWNNNGYSGGYAGGGTSGLYPWMNQSNQINDGFRDQMLNSNVTSIRDSIGDISTQLCNGFAGVNATVNSGFANAEVAANARQIANMQTAFAGQTAMTQGFNQLGSQFADCLKKIIKKAKDSLVFTKYTVGSCAA